MILMTGIKPSRPQYDKEGNPNFDTQGNYQGCRGIGCEVDVPDDDSSSDDDDSDKWTLQRTRRG
jgi:hypothetical protein